MEHKAIAILLYVFSFAIATLGGIFAYRITIKAASSESVKLLPIINTALFLVAVIASYYGDRFLSDHPRSLAFTVVLSLPLYSMLMSGWIVSLFDKKKSGRV